MLDHLVLSEEQLACLASPVRNIVHGKVREMGKASGRQIAVAIGKSPETVHYHLKALQKVGLITEVERRPSPKKPESLYGPTAKRLTLPPANVPEVAALIGKAVLAGMRQFVRGYEASTRANASTRLFSVTRANLRLRPEDLELFLKMVEEAGRFAAEHQSADGDAVQWLSALYPTG